MNAPAPLKRGLALALVRTGMLSLHRRRFEKARAEAAAPADGPFRGVPFLLKDILGMQAGEPYHMGLRRIPIRLQLRCRRNDQLRAVER